MWVDVSADSPLVAKKSQFCTQVPPRCQGKVPNSKSRIVSTEKEVRVGVSADSPLVAVPGRLIRAQSPPRWPLLRCLLRINTPLTATLLPALLHCDKPLHSLQRASQLLDSWLQAKCTSFAKLSSSLGSCQAFFATTASFSSPSR